MSGSSSKKQRRTDGPNPARSIPADDAALNRMFRRICTECGSTELEWASMDILAEEGSAEDKAFVAEMIPNVGPGGEAWRCTKCGERGAFGAMQSGF